MVSANRLQIMLNYLVEHERCLPTWPQPSLTPVLTSRCFPRQRNSLIPFPFCHRVSSLFSTLFLTSKVTIEGGSLYFVFWLSFAAKVRVWLLFVFVLLIALARIWVIEPVWFILLPWANQSGLQMSWVYNFHIFKVYCSGRRIFHIPDSLWSSYTSVASKIVPKLNVFSRNSRSANAMRFLQ